MDYDDEEGFKEDSDDDLVDPLDVDNPDFRFDEEEEDPDDKFH